MIDLASRAMRGGRTTRGALRGAIALTFMLGACDVDRPTRVLAPGEVALAKGAGGGGGGTSAVTVSATSPTSAPQDTTLDVTVSGSGFAKGAKATWSLAGDTSVVHVVSTRYVNSTTLVARISVPVQAPTTQYDVEVTLADGKKGVGAELFLVTQKDPTATFKFPLADATLGLKSDGRLGVGAYSVYSDGACGVQAKIFATTQLSNSGDATMQTGSPMSKQKTCAARTVTVDYGDGTVWTGGTFMNVKTIANTTYSIPIGTTVPRFLLMDEGRCGGLRWRPVLSDGTVTGADEVLVTRVDASTWRVQSQPYPANKAYCINTGQLFNIAVDFTIVSSYPLP